MWRCGALEGVTRSYRAALCPAICPLAWLTEVPCLWLTVLALRSIIQIYTFIAVTFLLAHFNPNIKYRIWSHQKGRERPSQVPILQRICFRLELKVWISWSTKKLTCVYSEANFQAKNTRCWTVPASQMWRVAAFPCLNWILWAFGLLVSCVSLIFHYSKLKLGCSEQLFSWISHQSMEHLVYKRLDNREIWPLWFW